MEIAVLSAELRPTARAPRLIELIHRAIPYPVFLNSVQAGTVTLSVATKRFAQNEAGIVVLDGPVTFLTLANPALLTYLSLASQPRTHLLALYDGWLSCLEGFQAAQITGRYSSVTTAEAAVVRRDALAAHARLVREIAILRAQAERQTQVQRLVELNLEIKRLEAALAQALTRM